MPQREGEIPVPIDVLSAAAWGVREHGRVLGRTRVGCAAVDEAGNVHTGCNIEHHFRSHDIHAEIAAVGALVSFGGHRLVAILIAAERELFTPCGACLDWIFELGGPDCLVLVEQLPGADPMVYRAGDLMPHYPH